MPNLFVIFRLNLKMFVSQFGCNFRKSSKKFSPLDIFSSNFKGLALLVWEPRREKKRREVERREEESIEKNKMIYSNLIWEFWMEEKRNIYIFYFERSVKEIEK